MPVAPTRNNRQGQPLTVLLRSIISEYPAGGGVLRELCQNADDAGADAIEFVLDTQHPTENLLHKGLAEFQGISLLAYNNKPFTEKDFESLMRIGDAFKGVIIRLPLRNQDQAIRSKIVEDNLFTSQKDIEDVFQLFTNELMESLLFLRNLRSITLRIDNTTFAKAESTVPNETKNDRGEDPINEGYRQVFVEKSKERHESDLVMEISILRIAEPGTAASETKVKYAISHHLRKSAEDENLQEWARNHKLFPWVTIANPLDKTPDFDGRLFTTLPLPIQTRHPAHTHGIFSITPDRSNIHCGGDTTMSSNSATLLGAQWNQWLLHECVPHAWVRNLEFMRNQNFSPGWDCWPAGGQGELGQLWMGILGTVLTKVVENGLGLLPTVSGMLRPAEEVAFTLDIPEDLHLALRDTRAQVAFPPADRRKEISALDHQQIGLEYLSPSTGRRHLTSIKDSEALLRLGIEPRMVLLDYILSDPQVREFESCEAPLIPLSDGTFRGFEIPAS
ncbi:hypothetical protein C7212DRAFT_365216 [Tuber magnatum]|uniref:Sacsin/Nov domain-containing protein n=1 Tax=Tuber magnatum TaxID=42249 RepID=A0A317SJV5_9PEZI|nr:hypothetical protein C7212DRAFT_365216 [Tuber magnatum]